MKEPFDKLWNTAVRFQERYDTWTKGPILGLNAEEVAEEVRVLIFKSKVLKSNIHLISWLEVKDSGDSDYLIVIYMTLKYVTHFNLNLQRI